MSDDLERAVLFSCDSSGAVDDALRARAAAYLAGAQKAPGAWREAVERFAAAAYAEVRFWCLQTLHAALPELLDQERAAVRAALCEWLRAAAASGRAGGGGGDGGGGGAAAAHPPYLLNKLAQLCAAVVADDYPARWPSFFGDLIALLDCGPPAVDLFCRVLCSLDEEVICLDVGPRPGAAPASMRVKDALRGTCIAQLAEACWQLVVLYQGSDPRLAADVLGAYRRYIHWVDIGLSANATSIGVLRSALESGSAELRAGAAGCVRAVISKQMEPAPKVRLLQELGVAELCAYLGKRAASGEEGEEGVEAGAVVVAVVRELTVACKHADEANDAGSAAAADALLLEVLPAQLWLLSAPADQVVLNALAEMTAHVQHARRRPSPRHDEHLRQSLRSLAHRAQFPVGEELLSSSDPMTAQLEEEANVVRFEIFNVWKSLTKTSPGLLREFVAELLTRTLHNANATFQEVEVSLTLLYHMGDMYASDLAKKQDDGSLTAMMDTVLCATPTLPVNRHRLVALAYLENCVRYGLALQQLPHRLPSVLEAFLDDRGIYHPDLQVSSRASYLFMRLVKMNRQNLAPHVATILRAVEIAVQRLSAQPLADGAAASSTASRPVDAPGEKGSGLSAVMDERLNLFEAIGIVLGTDDLPEAQQLEVLTSVVKMLCGQIEGALASAGSAAWATPIVTLAVEGIARLSKGFTARTLTTSRPALGAVFQEAVRVVTRVLHAMPRSVVLRRRVAAFFHRMAEALSTSLIPVLQEGVHLLTVGQGYADGVVEGLVLVNQLVCRLKEPFHPILAELFGPLVRYVAQWLPRGGGAAASEASAGATGRTEEARERQSMHKAFLNVVHAVVSTSALPILGQADGEVLEVVVASVLHGLKLREDAGTQKLCGTIFSCLIRGWLGPGAESGLPTESRAAFRWLALERFGGECCVAGVLRGDVDLNDAAGAVALMELLAAQRLLCQYFGEEYVGYVRGVVLPGLQCPTDVAEQYIAHLARAEPKALRQFLRTLVPGGPASAAVPKATGPAYA